MSINIYINFKTGTIGPMVIEIRIVVNFVGRVEGIRIGISGIHWVLVKLVCSLYKILFSSILTL